MKRFIMTLAAACLCWGASAEIVLPKVLGSNMVLQQQSEVNLWGKADADSKVTVVVSWSNDKIQTHSDADGRWAVKVATPAASFDPQTITISDGESVTLENILIGDVWVCSGQSNMEMPVKGFGNQPVENSIDYIMRGSEEASRIRALARMNYDTMYLFRMTRADRNRCLDVICTYYRLHLPDFNELKSLPVLQELF